MSDEKPKTMMNEVLPRPVSFSGTAARARVISHLRVLTATGAATLTLAACPFLAVDPLPPPPRCRTTRGVAADLSAMIRTGGNFEADAGISDAGTGSDGGVSERFSLQLTTNGFAAVDLPLLIGNTNTRRAELQNDGSGSFTVVFEPSDPAQPVTLRFTTTCEGTAAVVLLVTLTPTPNSSSPYSISLADAP
jgi:hypothetical protein